MNEMMMQQVPIPQRHKQNANSADKTHNSHRRLHEATINNTAFLPAPESATIQPPQLCFLIPTGV
jgi:hypothetical protein